MLRSWLGYVLISLLLAGAVGVATLSLLQQRRTTERLVQAERTLAEHGQTMSEMMDTRRQDNRNFSLWLHVQEHPWFGRADAPIQARIATEAELMKPSQPFRVMAEIRNASDRDQTVAALLLIPATVKLYCDGALLQDVGPRASVFQTSPLITLKPNEVAHAVLTLTPDAYKELAAPGNFELQWSYTSRTADGTTWAGELPPVKATWRSQ